MPHVEDVIRSYRELDPLGWVTLFRLIPTWLGLVLVGLGIALLGFGGGRLFRIVAVPLGMVVGSLWAPVVAQQLNLSDATGAIAMGAALGLAALGFVIPSAGLFFAFGLPAGIALAKFAGPNEWVLGFAPGFILVGTAAAFLGRFLGAIASSIVGAWLICMGALATLHQIPAVGQLALTSPQVVLIAAGVLAVAGSVYQLVANPPPETEDQERAERARAKRRAKEKKALEERWANYSDRDRK